MSAQPRTDNQRWGRKGGLVYAARNDVDAAMERARIVLLDSFESGHVCKVCTPGQVIPEELPEPERRRRAAQLRTLHFTNIANKRHHGQIQRKLAARRLGKTASSDEVSRNRGRS